MVGHRIERLTLIRLICTGREAAQRKDKPLVNQGERRSKPCCRHFFLLLDIHQGVDFEAVAEYFIIAAHTTHYEDVPIAHLKRLSLDWNFLFRCLDVKLLGFKVNEPTLMRIWFQKVDLCQVLLVLPILRLAFLLVVGIQDILASKCLPENICFS